MSFAYVLFPYNFRSYAYTERIKPYVTIYITIKIDLLWTLIDFHTAEEPWRPSASRHLFEQKTCHVKHPLNPGLI